MSNRDYDTYRNLFMEMTSYLQPPDVLVYLKASIPTLLKQISLRGREFEKNIDVNYMTELNFSYETWINNYNLGKKLIIETDELDFVHSEKDFDDIIDYIEKTLLLDLRLFI
jgi:hypothetical protein